MKTNLRQWMRQIVVACGFLALAAPPAMMAQQTVFNDTFANSTINQASTNDVAAPQTRTSYDVASGKNCTSTTIAPGHFGLECASTSAGYVEAQGVFSAYPITLASPGDTIDIQFVFTDTTNIFNGKAGNNSSLAVGLFHSGGSLPYTNLWNGGLSSGNSYAASGGVQNWLGYRANLTYNPGGTATSEVRNRPAQTYADDRNQTLIQEGSGGFAGDTRLETTVNSWVGLSLTVGNQYTVDYQITVITNDPLTLGFTNILYDGVGTGGTILATNGGTTTGATILTTSFDSFVIGGERTGSVQTTNDINQVIVTFISTNQPGPFFIVTGVGGCGLTDVSLSGSVTTNVYWVYTNGVNSGQSMAGTGSALDFGAETIPGLYTVIASNTVTGSQGPMWGSATVIAGAPVFNNAPASVVCATNSLATFSANATGANLSYHWFLNDVQLLDGAGVSGSGTTNLVISPAQAADAGTYYLVVTNPCGYSITSSVAILTIEAPYNLVWQGNNPDNSWDLAVTANFLDGANPQAFTNGDNVTFNDSSSVTSVSITGNTIVPTLINVTGTQNYVFGGKGSIVGSSAVLVSSSATLTVTNNNNYSGGTVVSNTATLALGDGTFVGRTPGESTSTAGQRFISSLPTWTPR